MYNPKVLVHEKPQTFELPPNVKSWVDERFTGKHPEGHWNPKNYSNIMSQLKTIEKVVDYMKRLVINMTSLFSQDLIHISKISPKTFPPVILVSSTLLGYHPRFPDVIHIFGRKYLGWMKNAFYDIDHPAVYENIWEPSPETSKEMHFC